MNYSELNSGALVLLSGLLFFMISYYLFLNKNNHANKAMLKQVDLPRNYISKLDGYILLIQLVILANIVFSLFFVDGEYLSGNIVRILESKFSQMFCLLQAVLYVIASKKIRPYVFVFSLIVSISYAWFDGSRASLLPLLGILFVLISNKNKLQFLMVLLIQIYIFLLAISSRSVDLLGKFSFEQYYYVNLIIFKNLIDIFKEVLSYMTAFSVMHFSFVINEGKYFSLKDLLYSTLPIPSFILNKLITIDSNSWRVDLYRPLGGLGQLYSANILFL
ncbi:hypothetical protein AB4505_12595, partial [Vibrio splendidus]